jgi:type IV secretion system protein VirB1
MLADLPALVQQCAPNVGPVTMQAIIKTESAGHAYALADAGPANLPWSQRKNMVRSLYPASADEAEKTVNDLVAKGHIVAIGLTQVNVKNLPALGLTVRQVLEPCSNIAAGAKVLTNFYNAALKKFGTGDKQAALLAAISAYWSGDFQRGFTGGYVQQVVNNAGLNVTLKIPNLAAGSVVRGYQGTFHVQANGVVSPYSAPLDAWQQQTKTDAPAARSASPRYAPLEAAGFVKVTAAAE